MGSRRVVVTGLGAVTPLGTGMQRLLERIYRAESGISKLEPRHLPESHRGAYEQLTSRVAGLVDREAFLASPWAPFPSFEAAPRTHTKAAQFALAAAREALQAAGYEEGAWDPLRCGVSLGVGMAGVAELADAGALVAQGRARQLSPHLVPTVLPGTAAGLISIAHGFQGPLLSPSAACATGAHAIGDALRLVRGGYADVMLAGGAESCIDAVSLGAFCRMRALATGHNADPAGASRPFDAARGGFVLAEGAGVLVLEAEDHARSRGAAPLCEVHGYGNASDAHHPVQPPPDGRGASRAMEEALRDGGVPPQEVFYVNAHATGTRQGDEAEARAIHRVFGKGAAVSSCKGHLGHLLGAAGAVEAAITVEALRSGRLPGTLNLEREDPDGALTGSGCLLGPAGAETGLDASRPAALSNSFGFGGTNTALLFVRL